MPVKVKAQNKDRPDTEITLLFILHSHVGIAKKSLKKHNYEKTSVPHTEGERVVDIHSCVEHAQGANNKRQ